MLEILDQPLNFNLIYNKRVCYLISKSMHFMLDHKHNVRQEMNKHRT